MALELHNFIWSEERLVQVETQPHHIAGVLAEVNRVIRENDLDWEDVYSAYYECEADGTTTFYEAECAEAGNPGIWTYVVYDCAEGEEEVITKADLDTLQPALELQQSLKEVRYSTLEERMQDWAFPIVVSSTETTKE